ncbi:prenyltransferase/squalene oxidase repeat-containing protein [Streptomyces sp. NPDC090442]|uniref:prenyltransferase/squalene oxidase repeat-containing protein n=1 Tax=Streptomyces sp. NPDC090442 TaxID=3365962 RepID=UPI00380A20E0
MPGVRLSSALLAGVRRAVDRATGYALATQLGNGSWCAVPDPRITETALCTLALARSPHPGAGRAAERGSAWLAAGPDPQRHHPVAHAMESALRSLALGIGGPVDVSHAAFADPALSARARLLQVVALHVGRPTRGGAEPAVLRTQLAAAVASPERLKRWTQVELWSAHALVESHFGDLASAGHAARMIADRQSPSGDFFANPVATALAALALRTAAPDTAAARRCDEYLIDSQLPDGTWRFASSDVWDTTLTVRVFGGAAAFDRSALPDAVAFLVAAQNADGGWPYRSGVESDNDTTAAALIALSGANGASDAVQPTIRAGLRHLAGQQLPDGLWRTWQSAGDPPVDDVIAHVVTALDRHAGRHRIPLAAARDWLAERLAAQGRWRAGWYRGLSYATAEVLPALDAAAHEGGHPAALALAATRNADGGWPVEAGDPSTPAATGLALAALERGGVHAHAHWAPGLAYLLTSQHADGSWPGVPLMYGPRPLLTHFPTQNHALTADGLFAGLRHLRSAAASDVAPAREAG